MLMSVDDSQPVIVPASKKPDVLSEKMRRHLLKQQFKDNTHSIIKWKRIVARNNKLASDGIPMEIHEKMKNFVGLDHVKQQLASHFSLFRLNHLRVQYGLPEEPFNANMVFLGNPGTGKTTTAQVLGSLLKEAGVINKGHVVEITPNDIFDESWCGTEIEKMKKKIEEAQGGILFIDEAHNFPEHAGSNTQFWRNSITTLMKEMTATKNPNFVVILAGYEEGMNYLFRQEPGMNSRFPNAIHFPDYTDKELAEIFKQQASQSKYELEEGCQEIIVKRLKTSPRRQAKDFGNARFITNVFNDTVKCLANRLVPVALPTKDDVSTITLFDVNNAMNKAGATKKEKLSIE